MKQHYDDSLVSICMPVYNRPALLKNALDHLIAQSYKNIEIIVSDDCSPDEEVRCVLRKYDEQDKRIKLFFQEKNLGALPNQEFVIARASGEYIMIYSEDDFIEKDYIKNCYEFLSSHSDYSMACTKFISQRLNPDGSLSKNFSPDGTTDIPRSPMLEPSLLTVDSAAQRYINLFVKLDYYYIYSGLMRRNIHKSVHQFTCLGHDRLFLSGVAYVGKIALIDKADSVFHFGGVDGTNEDYVNLLQGSKIEAYFPYAGQVFLSFWDILFISSIYKNMGFIKRFFFASRIFFIAFRVLYLKNLKAQIMFFGGKFLKFLLPYNVYKKMRKL